MFGCTLFAELRCRRYAGTTYHNEQRRETPSRRGHFHGQNRKQSLLGSLYWDFTETESRAWKVSGTEGNEPMEHKSRQVNKRESFVEKANNCHSSIKFMAEMSATAKLAERCTGIAWYKPEFFSGFLFATAKVAYDCDDHPSFKEITFLDTKVYRGVRFNNDNK